MNGNIGQTIDDAFRNINTGIETGIGNISKGLGDAGQFVGEVGRDIGTSITSPNSNTLPGAIASAYEKADFQDITHGMSASGIQAYLDEINIQVINKAISRLENTAEIKTALRQSWSGESCEAFIRNMDGAIKAVIAQIKAADVDMRNRMGQIQDSFITEDKKLVEDISFGGVI